MKHKTNPPASDTRMSASDVNKSLSASVCATLSHHLAQ